jgi:hypothetical protein
VVAVVSVGKVALGGGVQALGDGVQASGGPEGNAGVDKAMVSDNLGLSGPLAVVVAVAMVDKALGGGV